MTIVKITKNIVYIANPWHPDKIEPIPRHEFIKMAILITATPIKSSTTPNNTIEIPQSILDKITSYRKK